MSTTYQTFDRDERQSGQHFRAIDKRARLADVREEAGTFPSAHTVHSHYADTTASANFILKPFRCAYRFRHFIDVLVGLAGNNKDWFEVTDQDIASHAGRSKKWVQETRREFIPWQKRHNVGVVDIEDHKYQKGEIPKPHRYRVNLSRAAVEATLDAYASPDFDKDSMSTLEESADTYRSSLPETPTHKKHNTGGRASAESSINQRLRAAATNIRGACAIRTATGNNVEFDDDACAELEQAIELWKEKRGVRLTKQPVNTEEKRQAVSCEPADGFCARCESEGHAAETCPMPDDADTRRTADKRRDRRQQGVVEPSGGVVELYATTPPNTQENQQDTESAENSPPDSSFSPDVLTDDDYTQHDREFWQCVKRHVADGKDRNHAVTLARDEIGTISDWYVRRHAKGGSDGWIH
ncbi:MAG: hypothetical protein M3R15_06620 [Acidobacteriota bacterium]|nr:hypothetical protein [Acidobacteriota bacterium]